MAVAGSGPFGYEWYFAGTNLVQSGTNSTLTLPNVSTNNAGNYTVVVTNNYGSVTSQVATLTVAFPPSVTIQPASQTNLPGTTVSFSVAVDGTGPFTYQWQFNGTNLPNNIITTVAGNGSNSYSGDGGAATNASLYYPSGVAFDASGNLYIADTATTASARWTPTASSPPWRAMALWLFRRWRRGHQRQPLLSLRRGLRCLRQPVYC